MHYSTLWLACWMLVWRGADTHELQRRTLFPRIAITIFKYTEIQNTYGSLYSTGDMGTWVHSIFVTTICNGNDSDSGNVYVCMFIESPWYYFKFLFFSPFFHYRRLFVYFHSIKNILKSFKSNAKPFTTFSTVVIDKWQYYRK